MANTTVDATPRRRLALGPALVTAALVFGPGSITTASSLGASFSYRLLWIPVIATVLMLCFVDLSVRIGLTSDKGPVGTVAAHTSRIVAVLVAIGSVLIVSSFQAGNSVGTGAAANVLFAGDTKLWAGIFTAAAIAFVWLPGFYGKLEKLMVGIIAVMLVAFVITAIVSRPDPAALVAGLMPIIPTGSEAMVVGAVATTFSIVGAFYQIQLVRQRGWGAGDYRAARRDAISGTLILGTLSFVIILAAAAALHPQGIAVKSPADMANILTPTVGQWAGVLFALGLWSAAFSSLLGNATIGGGLLSAMFGNAGEDVNNRLAKICITAVLVVGGVVAIIFGGIPVQLILTAQAITVFIAPLIGIVLVWIARHRSRGDLRIGWPQTVLAVVGLVFLFFLAATYIQRLIA
ncbi:divalent metal cation transporter [Propioniciclava coleopterorum]|uniref:Divalent metal cation transporter n=1 Tax=Propioniciclava coleopterorum TaxID=2714937 RepID=A0A6G7Y2T7_9ACTN|nr:Nramp family divalent metal transporter [Propioniciclava coleopterorum]QIK71019.1 divalent metal cation transporter [Propioniciclava coleopterorum]